MKIESGDCLLTIEETARLLSLSPATVRTYCSNGKIPRLKVFDETRVLKSTVENLIQPDRRYWRTDAFTRRNGQSLRKKEGNRNVRSTISNDVVHRSRPGREGMPRPITPKLRPQPNQEPVAKGDGKEIEDGAATLVDISDGANNAPFSDKAGTPRSKPAARKAAAVGAGARPAKPFTPRFKALTFGKSISLNDE